MAEPIDKNPAPLPPPAASKLRPVIFGVVLLMCGVAIGSGATILLVRSEANRAMRDPNWMTQRAAARLEKDLNLTANQAAQVREIFQAHRERVHAFRSQHGDRARQMFRELQRDIEEVLTPGQAEKFRARLQRARERTFRNHDRWRGDRGDGPRDGDGDGRRRHGSKPDGWDPEGRRPSGPPLGEPPPEGPPPPQ